jgi:hypothetical protein
MAAVPADLLDYLIPIPDWRVQRWVAHPLAAVLALCAGAVVAGMRGFTAIAGPCDEPVLRLHLLEGPFGAVGFIAGAVDRQFGGAVPPGVTPATAMPQRCISASTERSGTDISSKVVHAAAGPAVTDSDCLVGGHAMRTAEECTAL